MYLFCFSVHVDNLPLASAGQKIQRSPIRDVTHTIKPVYHPPHSTNQLSNIVVDKGCSSGGRAASTAAPSSSAVGSGRLPSSSNGAYFLGLYQLGMRYWSGTFYHRRLHPHDHRLILRFFRHSVVCCMRADVAHTFSWLHSRQQKHAQG